MALQKAWGGRFAEATDPRVEKFTESISFDLRLAAVDIRGSKAHAQMLAEVGLISHQEKDQILAGLTEIGEEIALGKLPLCTELEDIHLHIEQALIARLGDVGRKLHTARSRNDQVATDLKLWTRDAIDQVDVLLQDAQRAFVERCVLDREIVLPGYTHLQRAQPVMAAHYWLAYCEKLQRDRERLADCRKRVNLSPLGAAALAGTTLPIDRDKTALLMGFDAPARNSLDISSDRDFVIEYVMALAITATHLATWAEEWILWCTTEFGFLRLRDAYTTGSSIMPQKKNPDVLELIRGRSARVSSQVTQLLLLFKGLPLAYNRDLQEDKLALFQAHDALVSCLELVPAIVDGAELNRERIDASLEQGFLDATALMEYLIGKQIPMRSAHEIVGRLVKKCESSNRTLADLNAEEFQEASPLIGTDVREWLGVRKAVSKLTSFGSGGPAAVEQQVLFWKNLLIVPSDGN